MTDSRYYDRLPRSCARELFAYLELLSFTLAWDRDPCSRNTQAAMAKKLGVSERTVKRWERALVDLGILEVVHRQRWNRRKVRIRELKELPPPGPRGHLPRLREWGHACPYSGDTRVPTVDKGVREVENARALHTNLVREPNPHTPTVRKRNGAGVVRDQSLEAGLVPAVSKALSEFEGTFGVWRQRRDELVAGVAALQRLSGPRAAIEGLASIRRTIRSSHTEGAEGSRALGMLQGLVRKHLERGGPRTHALAHA